MPYGNVKESKDITDVLACVVAGYDTVQKITEKLKQSQSTVSMKLKTLRKNKVVKKSKWSYDVDWKGLTSIMKSAFEQELAVTDKNFLPLFDDKRLRGIMEAYSRMVVDLKHKPASIRDIAWKYLLGMSQSDDKEVKSVDKRFPLLKKKLMAMSEEKYLFLTSEDVTDKKESEMNAKIKNAKDDITKRGKQLQRV